MTLGLPTLLSPLLPWLLEKHKTIHLFLWNSPVWNSGLAISPRLVNSNKIVFRINLYLVQDWTYTFLPATLSHWVSQTSFFSFSFLHLLLNEHLSMITLQSLLTLENVKWGLGRWPGRWRHARPSLTTWVRSLEPARWKARINTYKLSSNLDSSALAQMYTQ